MMDFILILDFILIMDFILMMNFKLIMDFILIMDFTSEAMKSLTACCVGAALTKVGIARAKAKQVRRLKISTSMYFFKDVQHTTVVVEETDRRGTIAGGTLLGTEDFVEASCQQADVVDKKVTRHVSTTSVASKCCTLVSLVCFYASFRMYSHCTFPRQQMRNQMKL